MSGCIRTTAGVKIACSLDSRFVFYDSDDFKSHRPAWVHIMTWSHAWSLPSACVFWAEFCVQHFLGSVHPIGGSLKRLLSVSPTDDGRQ